MKNALVVVVSTAMCSLLFASDASQDTPERPNAVSPVYLSQLSPQRVSVYTDDHWGFGSQGLVGDRTESRIVVNGEPSPHGLGTHPRSDSDARVLYRLNKSFGQFVGAVGINDTSPGFSTPLTFQILGDGRELWNSQPIHETKKLEYFDVSVKGVDRLELVVHCPGYLSGAHAVWVEPALYRHCISPIEIRRPAPDERFQRSRRAVFDCSEVIDPCQRFWGRGSCAPLCLPAR